MCVASDTCLVCLSSMLACKAVYNSVKQHAPACSTPVGTPGDAPCSRALSCHAVSCCVVQPSMMYEPPAARSDAALRHMLSGGLRRWVLYEWLYPAIDRPWFMKNELQVGVGVCGLGRKRNTGVQVCGPSSSSIIAATPGAATPGM